MPPLVFPDAVELGIAITVAGLASTPFAGVAVASQVPADRPDQFVVIARAGGTRRSIVLEDAHLVFETWAQNPADAQDLGQQVRAAVHAAQGTVVDGHPVYRVEDVEGLADQPDPLSDQPRYQFALSLTLRGSTPT